MVKARADTHTRARDIRDTSAPRGGDARDERAGWRGAGAGGGGAEGGGEERDSEVGRVARVEEDGWERAAAARCSVYLLY